MEIKPLKITCAGDSLVNGYPFPRIKSFPSVLTRKTGLETDNIGMNGITARDVSRVLDSKLAVCAQEKESGAVPDAVLISCGSNDFMLGTAGPAQVCDIVSEMAASAFGYGVHSVYVCAPPLTDPDQAQYMWMPGISYELINRQLEEYRQLLSDLSASARPDSDGNIHFIDIQTAYRTYAKYVDGVHPTAEGYELIADAVAAALK